MSSLRVLFAGILAIACVWPASLSPDCRLEQTSLDGSHSDGSVRFIENVGQWDERHAFVARQRSAVTLIERDGTARIVMYPGKRAGSHTASVDVRVSAPTGRAPIGEEPLHALANYFLGNDASRWRSSVRSFGTVRIPSADGATVRWYGTRGNIEYDVDLAPGVDPRSIVVAIDGADSLSVSNDGSLVISTAAGDLVQPLPTIEQRDVRGGRHRRDTRYRIIDRTHVGFDVDQFDPTAATLIDPEIVYSTFLGTTCEDRITRAASRPNGALVVTGYTYCNNFPTTLGSYDPSFNAGMDAFVAQFAPDGSTLDFSTYLGGSPDDYAFGMGLDSAGNIGIAGHTYAANFPVVSAAQPVFKGVPTDAFFAKLSSDGKSLLYSTYWGGATGSGEYVSDAAMLPTGELYAIGTTTASDFPLVSAQTSGSGPFVVKLASNGSVLFSERMAAFEPHGITLDASGNAFAVGTATSFPTTANVYQTLPAGGYDALVLKLVPNGGVGWATLLGGVGAESAWGIALDGSANVHVTGNASPGFPMVNPWQASCSGSSDAFWAKLDPSGSALLQSTFLGGAMGEVGTAIAIDALGQPWIAGYTTSTDFPLLAPTQSASGGGYDQFLSRFSALGSLAFGTYLGGAGLDYGPSLALGPQGRVFVVGSTDGAYPTTNGAYQSSKPGYIDGVATLFRDTPSISPTVANVAPKGSVGFTASGGSGGGYAFSFSSNSSGATLNGSTGAYTAGSTPSVADVVTLTDGNGNSAKATVNVGPGVVISPPAPSVPPKGPVAFSASGGSNTGFAWSMSSAPSGGTINPSTGAYSAGAVGGATDVVQVVDSLGNVALRNVLVGPAVAINPPAPSVPPKGTLGFAMSGGSGTGATWSLTKAPSGGTINVTTGVYVAGATANVNDVVHVSDSLGNEATATVAVGAGVSITPAQTSVEPAKTVAFSAQGGSGIGYQWSVALNASGATIGSQTGTYVAGALGGQDTVQVKDSLGNSATASVQVAVVAQDSGVDTGADTGVANEAGTDADSSTVPPPPPTEADGGCSCRASPTPGFPWGSLLAPLVATVWLRRRSRDRSSHRR